MVCHHFASCHCHSFVHLLELLPVCRVELFVVSLDGAREVVRSLARGVLECAAAVAPRGRGGGWSWSWRGRCRCRRRRRWRGLPVERRRGSHGHGICRAISRGNEVRHRRRRRGARGVPGRHAHGWRSTGCLFRVADACVALSSSGMSTVQVQAARHDGAWRLVGRRRREEERWRRRLGLGLGL